MIILEAFEKPSEKTLKRNNGKFNNLIILHFYIANLRLLVCNDNMKSKRKIRFFWKSLVWKSQKIVIWCKMFFHIIILK